MISCISKNVLADIYTKNQSEEKYNFISDKSILEWEYRYPLLLNQILGYDIICLQEVQLEYIENNTYFINDLQEYDFYSHQISKKRTSEIGKSIDNNSCGIFVILEHLNKDFLIGNVHLRTGKNRDDVRIPQLKSCFKIINKYKIDTFLTGDFNDGLKPEYSTTNLILENNFKIEKGNKNTCHLYKNGNSIYLTLDHVITNNLNITFQENLENISEIPIPNETEGSDHLPLVFFVEFK